METLSARLMTVQNNYVLGLASLSLLTAPEADSILRRSSAQMGTHSVAFAQVADLFANIQHRDDACRSFLIMHMCSLVKDSFELCQHHCSVAKVMPSMKAEPWFKFCRLIRNCIAHKFLFTFDTYDLSILPVSWRGKTIDSTFQGHELPLEMFGYSQAWEMFLDIRSFAERTRV